MDYGKNRGPAVTGETGGEDEAKRKAAETGRTFLQAEEEVQQWQEPVSANQDPITVIGEVDEAAEAEQGPTEEDIEKARKTLAYLDEQVHDGDYVYRTPENFAVMLKSFDISQEAKEQALSEFKFGDSLAQAFNRLLGRPENEGLKEEEEEIKPVAAMNPNDIGDYDGDAAGDEGYDPLNTPMARGEVKPEPLTFAQPEAPAAAKPAAAEGGAGAAEAPAEPAETAKLTVRERLTRKVKAMLASAAVVGLAVAIWAGASSKQKPESAGPEAVQAKEATIESVSDNDIEEAAESILDNEDLFKGDALANCEKYDLAEVGQAVLEKYLGDKMETVGENGVKGNYASYNSENKSSKVAFGEAIDTEDLDDAERKDEIMRIYTANPNALAAVIANMPAAMKGMGLSEEIMNLKNAGDKARAIENLLKGDDGAKVQKEALGALMIILGNEKSKTEEVTAENRQVWTYALPKLDKDAATTLENLELRTQATKRNGVEQIMITTEYDVDGDHYREETYINKYCGGQPDFKMTIVYKNGEPEKVITDDPTDEEPEDPEDNGDDDKQKDEGDKGRKGDDGKNGGNGNGGNGGESQGQQTQTQTTGDIQKNGQNLQDQLNKALNEEFKGDEKKPVVKPTENVKPAETITATNAQGQTTEYTYTTDNKTTATVTVNPATGQENVTSVTDDKGTVNVNPNSNTTTVKEVTPEPTPQVNEFNPPAAQSESSAPAQTENAPAQTTTPTSEAYDAEL